MTNSDRPEPKSMEAVRDRLADYTLILVASFGLPAVLASLLRIRDIGWLPTMGLHIGVFVVILLMVFFRRHLPVVMKSGLILALLYIIGTGSYPTMGTAGSGVFFYLVTVVLGVLLFGFRTGLVMLVLCFLSLVAAFMGSRSGIIDPNIDFNVYVLSTSSWVSKIVTFLMLSSLILGLMSLMERWLSRSMAQMSSEIEERKTAETMLEDSLAEKDTLLREVHHRVKSNLQSVTSLLELQAARSGDMDSVRVLRDSRNRIRTMALIHEELYRTEDLSSVRFDEFLKRLLDNLKVLYSPGSENISFETDLEEVHLIMDTAIPCGLIVNELLTNSLIHAFPGGAKGQIKVTFQREGDDGYLLAVSDNGIGLSADPESSKPQTLGMQLIQSIAQQLKARTSYEVGDGTSFTMSFSEYREAGSDLF